ncbi:MAG: neuraminidase-like domain-containing protein [Deltaproteobacteria bacterium]
MEEARIYLQYLGTNRADLIKALLPVNASADKNAPSPYNWATEYLGISPIEVDIITANSENLISNGINAQVCEYYGFNNTSGYNPIQDPADSQKSISGISWTSALSGRVDVFLQQTGLQYTELLYMLNTRFINPEINNSGDRRITIQSTDTHNPATCVLKSLSISGLNNRDFAKIYRFIRLWRKLGISSYDLDRLMMGLSLQLSSDEDIIKIANVMFISSKLALEIGEVLPFWCDIETFIYKDYSKTGQPDIIPLYDKLFRNKAVVNPVDNIFTTIREGGSASFSGHTAAILAALQITDDEFTLLVNELAININGANLNKASLSNLYRNVKLAKALSLTIKDYLTLKAMIGINPFAGINDTVRFLENIDNVKSSGFSIDLLSYLLCHQYTEETSIAPTTQAIAVFLTELRTELKKVILKVTSEMSSAERTAAETAYAESRYDIIKQKIAEKLKITPAAAKTLLVDVLKGRYNPAKAVIEDFVVSSYLCNDLQLVKENAEAGKSIELPRLFENFILLDKIATFINKLKIADEELPYILTKSTQLGIANLSLLPIAAVSTAQFEQFNGLINLIKARDLLPFGTLAFFDIHKYTFNTELSNQTAKGNWIDGIKKRTNWDEALITSLVGTKTQISQGGILRVNFPADFKSGKLLLRLNECVDLIKRIGLSPSKLSNLVKRDLDADNSKEAKNAAKARHAEKEWYEIAKPLREQLRDKQRAALAAYLLARPSHNMHQYWRTTEELYEYLLIDVEMCPDMYTSRIKQAISSVQLYVDRVLMNLEHYNMDKTSDALKLSIDQVKEWREWRKLYRIWEANRKVFLYPENWIEPELRDDKSPFFKELESQLMQNEVTLENVEDAFLGYLEKLDAVSRLEIRGIYHQEEPENNIDIIHVIGRTHGMPHKYFYRKLVSGEWTAWEKIDLDIEGEHLIPIVWNRRLHLFWLVCVDKAQEGQIKMPNAGDSLTGANKYIEIKLAWSEYKKNKWTAKRVSKNFISSEAGIAASNSTGLDSDKITNWNDSLRNRYYLSCKPSSDKLNIIISKQESSLKHNPLYTFIFRNSNTEPEAYDSLKVNNYKVVPPPACYAEAGIFKGKISLCYDKYKVGASRVDPDSSPAAIQYQTIIDQYDKLLGAVEGGFSLALMPDKLLRPYSDSFFMQDSKSTFFVGRSTERVEDEFLGHRDMVDLSRLADILNHYYYEEIAYPFPEPDPVEFGDGITDPPMENIFDPINEEAILFNNIIDNPDTFVVINGQTIRGNEFTSNGLYIETYGESYPNNCAASYSGLMTKSMVLPSKTDMVYRSYTTNVSYNKDKMRGFKNNGVRHYHYEERFTFYTYYQPNVKALINELNKDGLDGMLNRSMQMVSDTMNFNQKYKPHEEIVRHISPYSYPDNCMDFSYGGAYSQYNWELFFHVPLMIALRLSQNQRFDEARKWFHYVFDPTNSEGGGKERFWQFKPFYDEAGKTPQTLEQLMKSINDNVQQVVEQVDKWMQNPFKPHVIARMRILAYMKNVVMKYIDNLISWADQLFRRDTIESINEATQLYVLASKILGERPQKVPPRAIPVVQTYEELDDKLDAFSNAMVNIELFIQPSTAGHISTGSSGNVLKMAYFGIAKNAKLLEYWDLVADRLFKIRHCMNIDGIVRQLPLFEPPIDPAMLVRAAASGMDLSSIISGSDVSLPNYRFSIMLQKANDLCNDVKSLGSVLLIALEKKDAEELALLRQSHEIRLLNAVRDVKKKQVDEAAENIESLKKGKIITQLKYAYYASRPFTNAYEAEHLYSLQAGIVLQLLQGGTEMIASALSAVPDIKIGAPTSLGATFGGSNIGMVMKAFSSYLGIMCEINKISGTLSSTLGSYHRRADDWKFQADCARKELDQVDNQIAAAEIRLAIAEKELQNHDVQMQNAQEVDEYMHNKYTNKELYEWMVEQLSTVYFQSYQLAFDMAKKAEKCLHYEIAADNMQYIQFGYWYSLKKGLLTGEKLQYDLRRMETAYMEKNKRHFELTKHISLAVFKPEAIIALKRDGFCSISLPEELFDLDYPGHYLRRIKSVSFTIPCIVGPYTTVNCTLRLKAHKTRLTPIGSNFETITSMSRTQAIATSSAQNDSGMFELNFRDERYLPFEGCGAISNWDIELSTDAVLRQFDYETISDVILNIRYTALEDGALKIQACENLKKVINNTIEGTNPMPLTRMFSLKHEFPAQWHKFLNNDVEGEEKVLELSITKDMFPYLSKGKNIKINGMYIYAKCKGTNPYVAWVSPPLTENNGDAIPLTLVSGMHQGSLDVSAKSVNLVTSQDNVWKLKMKKGTVDSSNPIESQDVEEIILVLKYNL